MVQQQTGEHRQVGQQECPEDRLMRQVPQAALATEPLAGQVVLLPLVVQERHLEVPEDPLAVRAYFMRQFQGVPGELLPPAGRGRLEVSVLQKKGPQEVLEGQNSQKFLGALADH